jgi:hypothetical protein
MTPTRVASVVLGIDTGIDAKPRGARASGSGQGGPAGIRTRTCALGGRAAGKPCAIATVMLAWRAADL